MKKIVITAIILVLIAIVVMIIPKEDMAGTQDLTLSENPIIQGNTAFAVDLYGQIKNQTGNLCFSPYGISTAMAMTYAGAKEQTEQEMAKTMHFTLPQKELHAAFGDMEKSIQGLERSGITITVANSLWCKNGYSINPDYTDLLKRDYNAMVSLLDFNNPSASAKTINSWFSDRTKGMIESIIDSNEIDQNTRAILGNAIYFKGQWVNKFDKNATRNGRFYTAGMDSFVEVPMMFTSAKCKLVYNDNFSFLQLPYAGNKLSMILLMPVYYGSLSDLEEQFTADNVKLWFEKLNQTEKKSIKVTIPRLKITCHFALDKTLAQMGMPSLFDSKNANLSGISDKNDLFVSSATHQAVLEINEEGTTAAAAIRVNHMAKSMPSSFIADHPFLYLIVDNRNGNILFCGRIIDPTKT